MLSNKWLGGSINDFIVHPYLQCKMGRCGMLLMLSSLTEWCQFSAITNDLISVKKTSSEMMIGSSTQPDERVTIVCLIALASLNVLKPNFPTWPNILSSIDNIIIKRLFEVFLGVCLNHSLNLHETFCIWKFIYLWWKHGTLQLISTPTSSSELPWEFKGNCYLLDYRM